MGWNEHGNLPKIYYFYNNLEHHFLMYFFRKSTKNRDLKKIRIFFITTIPTKNLKLASLKHENFLANFAINVIYSNFFNVHTSVLEIKSYGSR